MTEQPKSWLAGLCGLPIIGDWAATIVGLVPVIVPAAFQTDFDKHDWMLFLIAVAMVPWLLLLERWQGVAITMPYVPIKLVWLMYVAIVVLGFVMVTGWF